MTPYQALERRFARLSHLRDAANLLHWDMSTMMPPGGAEARARQLATLRVLGHGMLAESRTGALLDEAELSAGSLDPWQQANLREMRRQWNHATAVPSDLVEAVSRASSACEMLWRDARPASDFTRTAPALAEVLRLIREVAQAKAERFGCGRYDALLDEYEPHGRSARIDRVFAELEALLPPVLDRILRRQDGLPPAALPGDRFPIEAQRELAIRLMSVLGFDFAHGRLDTSFHPFCGGTPDDVRITTRYDERDFTQSLMGVLHETGHALYELGLPAEWRDQPVGRVNSMVLHESQSLLIEMQACRSQAFLSFAAPLMQEAFGGVGAAWSADNIHRLYTRVERGFIRVDADEVTYPLHVILRYRLERAMIEGDLEVADLPGAWNEGMRRLLGVTPPDDRRGCLQDIHWYDGAWGYFPTYTLGAIAAAQLFEAAQDAVPEAVPAVRGGDFRPLLAWLRVNIHAKASLLPTEDLLTEATGRPLDVGAFLRHIERRYLS